jgi:hypothetical protein
MRIVVLIYVYRSKLKRPKKESHRNLEKQSSRLERVPTLVHAFSQETQ